MTEDERYEKLNDKLDKILDKLSNKLEGVTKSLQNHEVRIVVLETKSPDEKKDWRTDIIQLLVKAVVIGGVAIASLAGAGGLLQKIMGG